MELKSLTVNGVRHDVPDPADEVEDALQKAKDSGEFDGPAGPQGNQGPAGANGYTPVRGVDYWTDADKEEIKTYVEGSLANGVSIVDRTTGKKYTVYVNNGKLMMEEVK